MIVPLFLEQLLVMMVGIVDTFVVSFVGESAVSEVSLVNMFNTAFYLKSIWDRIVELSIHNIILITS